ncbi:hypothetical protein Tco_0186202 [Tanacetum coccineum]
MPALTKDHRGIKLNTPIVTESVPEPTKKQSGSRSTRGVVFQDIPSAPKLKHAASKLKLKGVQSLTPEEQEATDIIKALKESRRTNKRQPGTGGSDEGISSKPRVPNESKVVLATSDEGTGTKPWVLDEEKVNKEKVILEWGSEHESEYSKEDLIDNEEKDDKDVDVDDKGDDHITDIQDDDDEDDETKSDEDDIYKYKICVRIDKDEEMKEFKVAEFEKGEEEITDAAKTVAEKKEVEKDDPKKAELPPTSSSLSVSSGFGDQFIKTSSDTSLISTVKDIAEADFSSLMDIHIQQETPHIQSPSVQQVLVIVIL